MKEINDNEIRVIGSTGNMKRRRWPWYGWLAVGVVLVVLVAVVATVLLLQTPNKVESVESPIDNPSAPQSLSHSATQSLSHSAPQLLTISDTVVDDVPLTLYMLNCLLPDCPRASLQVGSPEVGDSSLLLAVMAADVRADNGGVVGDFVVDGRQLARGEKKEGYCAILDGVPAIGRGGDAALSQALNAKGSFFRQYVLVSNGEAVPPKPKGKNHRRALCVVGHSVFVVASGDRESYHDFATALADLGVDNAIALVGSESLLIYRTAGGLLHSIGTSLDADNANFIVWRR